MICLLNLPDIINKIHCTDNLPFLRQIPSDSIDLLATDPPYGYSFMGKDWDKALPPTTVWKECLRILKPGAFAFIMSSPRQDVLSQMIVRIGQAGFETGFTSIYWVYASGFPKSTNISKSIDKKLGLKREIIGVKQHSVNFENAKKNKIGFLQDPANKNNTKCFGYGEENITKPFSPQAKLLNNSYAGFQPKPAVEIIIVAMKPLSGNSYVEQALKNSHGITWLDNCRIPYQSKSDYEEVVNNFKGGIERATDSKETWKLHGGGWKLGEGIVIPDETKGRFPANLLVSDDILNDGKKHSAGDLTGQYGTEGYVYGVYKRETPLYLKGNPVDSFSRYFDLDKWFEERIKTLPAEVQKVYPFLIVPKASPSEKNENLPNSSYICKRKDLFNEDEPNGFRDSLIGKSNIHPTVKPIKLFSYLITLGSRENDIILDPYIGSGTTAVSSLMLDRKFIGIDNDADYCKIANERIKILLNYKEGKEAFENSVSDEPFKLKIEETKMDEDMFL